ncbi:unnamed protein product [Gongylonema pulchrum]|uniref:MULE domain-containing protein n=1 Tax=Gongylonema pulchrum TaxID=637853 RepID=A0A183DBX0_9BILA|nr:unnamed protein product [Gongylonema pulchrum]
MEQLVIVAVYEYITRHFYTNCADDVAWNLVIVNEQCGEKRPIPFLAYVLADQDKKSSIPSYAKFPTNFYFVKFVTEHWADLIRALRVGSNLSSL